MGVPPFLARREQHASGNVLENPYSDMQIGTRNRTRFFGSDIEVFDDGEKKERWLEPIHREERAVAGADTSAPATATFHDSLSAAASACYGASPPARVASAGMVNLAE